MSLTPSAAAALRAELLARVAADQKARTESPANPTREQIAAMMAIDRANSARMRQVITVHGWPGKSVVGEDGSRAAWLLVQHGPDDLQEQALVLLSDAVRRGDASPGNLAYLDERRAAVGLGPHAESDARMRAFRAAKDDDEHPAGPLRGCVVYAIKRGP